MSYLQIGRLVLGPPLQWYEAVGDPITNLGGQAIPAPRQALRHQITISTLAGDGLTDTVAQRLILRRQLRSMLNNTPLKLQGYFYVIYSDDPDQNGWYTPDFGQLADLDAAVGLASGVWKLEQTAWIMAGHRRINREARNIWMKDMRTGLNSRDFLRSVFSLDFSALPALQLTPFPHGASSIANAVNGQVPTLFSFLAGRDGGVCQVAVGLVDLACVSYERPDSAWGASDVIVYDRHGSSGPFSVWSNGIPNGSFEIDVANAAPAAWSPAIAGFVTTGGATLTAINTQSFFGAQSMRVVTTAVSGEGANIVLVPPSGGFQAGTTYTFSVWLKGNAGGEHLGLLIGTTGVDQANNPNPILTTSWAQYTIDWAPLATETGPVYATIRSNTSSAYTFFVDGAMVGIGTTYVDGNSPGYTWAGTPGNSATITNDNAPSAGPGPTWAEAYGPDYAWSWVAATPTGADCPVLDNGLVRVRYDDSTGVPGFRVDVWTGTAYVEQGKMIVLRFGDTGGLDNTWISANLVEYTPDRAVVKVVLARSADPHSRELIFITMQRGEPGCIFEVYPAIRSDGATPADVALDWTPALNTGIPDLNVGVAKIDSQGATPLPSWTPGISNTGVYVATAGMGAGTGHSGLYPSGQVIGAVSFATSENWMSILRCPTAFATVGPYQTNLAVVIASSQVAAQSAGSPATGAYGITTNWFSTTSTGSFGYQQVQLGFTPTVADQVMEAENMTLGTNTTTVADSSASGTGNNTTQATRTTDANPHVSRATWPNGQQAQYRIFARVRSTASHASFYVKTGATTGATVVLPSPTTPTYQWIDLGEVTANNTTLEIHAWVSTGTGTIDVDRIEAIMTQDRVRNGAIYSGARDQAQAALFDSRVEGCLVAR